MQFGPVCVLQAMYCFDHGCESNAGVNQFTTRSPIPESMTCAFAASYSLHHRRISDLTGWTQQDAYVLHGMHSTGIAQP